jgi:hypothetical protein
MRICLSVLAVAALAGTATAQLTATNGYQLRAFENFGGGQAVHGTASFNGSAVLPGNIAVPLGPSYAMTDNYPALEPGFANRHLLFTSTDGGATAYQLQAGESFRMSATFRIAPNAGYPVGPGAPANSEAGFWFVNPRIGGGGTPFNDEGGIWLITNGTSFAGGAGMDFFLFGEGNGAPNPPRPPIYTAGGEATATYEYFAANYFGPGSAPGYVATVTDLTSGISVTSGLKPFFADDAGQIGLNPGTLIGFRYQHQIFPASDNQITTTISGISIIPTPGALALLGMGGLLAARRRR